MIRPFRPKVLLKTGPISKRFNTECSAKLFTGGYKLKPDLGSKVSTADESHSPPYHLCVVPLRFLSPILSQIPDSDAVPIYVPAVEDTKRNARAIPNQPQRLQPNVEHTTTHSR